VKNAVVVFAKTLESGNAKTRIAEEAGRQEADRIYLELLEATARTVRGFDHFVSYLGDGGPGGLKSIFLEAVGFLPQKGAHLGKRLRFVLGAVQDQGYEALCAIGTDCPDLIAGDLVEVFALLDESSDVVIGPASDGGYYLIAMMDPACGVFDAKGWGRSTLLAETLAIVEQDKLRRVPLPEKEDIDTLAAYRRSRPEQRGE